MPTMFHAADLKGRSILLLSFFVISLGENCSHNRTITSLSVDNEVARARENDIIKVRRERERMGSFMVLNQARFHPES